MADPQINMEEIDCPTMRGQLKNLVEDLQQLCPSDACVRATFRKVHDRFVGDIRVASESVYMQAVDSASAVTDVLEHIRTKMLSQIIDWRNHRFAS